MVQGHAALSQLLVGRTFPEQSVQADAEAGRLSVSVPAKPGVSYTIRFVGTKRDFKAGVEAEVLFKGDERAQVGERRLPIYSETIGVVFKSVSGKPGERVEASYALQADDLYVRAIVESSEAVTGYAKQSPQHPQHPQAWTQPLRRKFSP